MKKKVPLTITVAKKNNKQTNTELPIIMSELPSYIAMLGDKKLRKEASLIIVVARNKHRTANDSASFAFRYCDVGRQNLERKPHL